MIMKRYIKNTTWDDLYQRDDDPDVYYTNKEDIKIEDAVSEMSREYSFSNMKDLGRSLYVDFYESYLEQEPDTEPYAYYKLDTDYSNNIVYDIAIPFENTYIVFCMDCDSSPAYMLWWTQESHIDSNSSWVGMDEL